MVGPGERPALQRVVVHAVLTREDELLLVDGVLPHAVLQHGATPAQGIARALQDVTTDWRVGTPVAVHDGTRRVHGPQAGPHDGGVDVHTVHVVLPVSGPSRPGYRWPPGACWSSVPEQLPLVADAQVAVEGAELRRLVVGADAEVPVVRQRLAAYAVVVADDADGRSCLLLTRLSGRTPSPGRWTLPGGGVDHGEHPLAAVVREVCEETGHDVDVDGWVDIGSEHFTGRSPRGVLEDFHAVRVLVGATVRAVREPEVLDVGGSTDLSRWVPLDEAAGIGLVGVAHRGLSIARRHEHRPV